jgi:hypothetical protein
MDRGIEVRGNQSCAGYNLWPGIGDRPACYCDSGSPESENLWAFSCESEFTNPEAVPERTTNAMR